MSYLSRLGAFVAASALTVTGLVLVAPPAQAAPDTRAVGQGAAWLADQLTDGLIYNPNYGGFNDYGLSIDVLFALDAVGGHTETVKQIGKAIREHYYSYVTDFDSPYGNTPATQYAGGIGKALVASQIAGSDPAIYRNRVTADLEERVSDAAPIVGRIENANDFVYPPPSYDPVPGDSANVFGQVFAARGLVVAGSDEADEALSFLLAQQCADGGFRENFDDKADSDQGCDPADTATFGDRIGATATAVLNLDPISGETGVAAALASARAWLVTQQNQDGSFGANGGNANSTGIAARAIGTSPEASAAAAWLRDLQINDTDACTAAGATNIGAIAFTASTLADARANGIPVTAVDNGKQDSMRRASAQAVPGLAFLEADPAVQLDLSGPQDYLRAGSTAVFTVAGAAADSALCISTVGGNQAAGMADGSGAASISLGLPGGTANRTVTVIDPDGNTGSVTAKVLGRKRLSVRAATARVKRGRAVRVVVSGLAPDEQVRLRVRGHQVVGSANASGSFAALMRPGTKLGRARVIGYGQFGQIRRGATVVRVVR